MIGAVLFAAAVHSNATSSDKNVMGQIYSNGMNVWLRFEVKGIPSSTPSFKTTQRWVE